MASTSLAHRAHRSSDGLKRGRALFRERGAWLVPSAAAEGTVYEVRLGPVPRCECSDHAYRCSHCLHIAAATVANAKSVTLFILHGDIPWPYPKVGNAVGFSASHEAEGDPARRDLCWQMCPMCQGIMIGPINAFSCRGCKEELCIAVEAALDGFEAIPIFEKVIAVVPAMVNGGLGEEFFRSGHKALPLQEAYGKARAARFEGRRRRSA